MNINELKNLPTSIHLRTDHPKRWDTIKNKIGYGDRIILESPDGRNGNRALTNSGVLFITSRNNTHIITAYVPSVPKVSKWYQKTNTDVSIKEFNQVIDKIIENQDNYKECTYAYSHN